MKIAVASLDGSAISAHFGQSRCFLIFEAEGGHVSGPELRDNTYTPHAKGECDGEHEHHHDQPHSHANVVAALRDCQVLVCGGMGMRAAQDLQAGGIRPVMVDPSLSPAEAVAGLLAGTLRPGPGFCRCHH